MKPSVCRLAAVYEGRETACLELVETAVSQSERGVIWRIKFIHTIMQPAAQVDQLQNINHQRDCLWQKYDIQQVTAKMVSDMQNQMAKFAGLANTNFVLAISIQSHKLNEPDEP